jgi:hypothetical protein
LVNAGRCKGYKGNTNTACDTDTNGNLFIIDGNQRYQFCKGWHCINYIINIFGDSGKKVDHPSFLCEKKKKKRSNSDAADGKTEEKTTTKKAKAKELNLSGNNEDE